MISLYVDIFSILFADNKSSSPLINDKKLVFLSKKNKTKKNTSHLEITILQWNNYLYIYLF